MKKYVLILGTSALILIGVYLVVMRYQSADKSREPVEVGASLTDEVYNENWEEGASKEEQSQAEISVVAENLNIPWDLVFLPDGSMLVTERPGILRKIGGEEFTVQLPEVVHLGEGGLLGITLHPNFKENNWLYLYFTTRSDGKITNMVQRYTLFGNNIGVPLDN